MLAGSYWPRRTLSHVPNNMASMSRRHWRVQVKRRSLAGPIRQIAGMMLPVSALSSCISCLLPATSTSTTLREILVAVSHGCRRPKPVTVQLQGSDMVQILAPYVMARKACDGPAA